MFQRFIYVLCGVTLCVFYGHKVWQEKTLTPHYVIKASHAHEKHLDGKGVIVAVIDEGFDSTHTFLKDRFSPYYNTKDKTQDISETLIFENGKYRFESHGTHVAGIITSLAPQVKIIPIKVSGFGGDQAFVKALQIAALSPAHIINISLQLSRTGRELSPNVRNALIQLMNAGKLVVIAAGNEGAPLMRNAYTASLVQLAHESFIKGRLLLAGASSYKDGVETLAEFSNYPGNSFFGTEHGFFITAPGDHITSTIPGNMFGEKSGTSMASPMVVGAASLLKQAFPHLNAEDIAFLLLMSARKISLDGKELSSIEFGAGIINLKAALEQGKNL